MRQRESTVVACPIEDAFAFLADPRNLPAWVGPVSDVELVDATETVEVGTRFEQRVDADEGTEAETAPARFTGRIVEHAPPERVAFRFEGEAGHVETTFELEATRRGTRITEAVEVPLTRWATKLLAPVLWLVNRRRLKEQLAELEHVLATETATPADPG